MRPGGAYQLQHFSFGKNAADSAGMLRGGLPKKKNPTKPNKQSV
jgi:hypothetical protein